MGSGRPLVVEDARQQAPFAGMSVTEDVGIGSYIGVPVLLSNGQIYGTLCAIDPDVHRFDQGDVEMLVLLARLLADQIDRERIEAALRASDERYRLVFENIQ